MDFISIGNAGLCLLVGGVVYGLWAFLTRRKATDGN